MPRSCATGSTQEVPLKSHTVYRTFHTERRREFVRITEDVQQAVDESGVSEGMVDRKSVV